MTRRAFYPGETLFFHPTKGKPLRCVVQYEGFPTRGKTLVKIGTDPFSTYVRTEQLGREIRKMVAEEQELEAAEPVRKRRVVKKTNTRRVGRPAKAEAVAEVVPMQKRGPGRPKKVVEAAAPVKRGPGRPRKVVEEEAPPVRRGPGRPRKNPVVETPVKRGPGRPRKNPVVEEAPKRRGRPPTKAVAAKKAPAKRAPANKVTVTDPNNPFRPGTQSYAICKALVKGGTRRKLAEQLNAKITPGAWARDIEDPIKTIDTRMQLTAYQLETKYGWTIQRSGRGIEGKIKAIPA